MDLGFLLDERTNATALGRGEALTKAQTQPSGNATILRAKAASQQEDVVKKKTVVIALHKRCLMCKNWASWGPDPKQTGRGGRIGKKLRCTIVPLRTLHLVPFCILTPSVDDDAPAAVRCTP